MVVLGLTGSGFRAEAQHIHLVAGAESPVQGAKLRLGNAASYDSNSTVSGGSPPNTACFFMSDDDPDLYPHLFQVEVGFSALPATLWTGGPAPGAAAQGSYIEARLVSVGGPDGGEIGFWEQNEEATVT